jgi:hypothetical protein
MQDVGDHPILTHRMKLRIEHYKTLSVFWTILVLIEIVFILLVAIQFDLDKYILGLYAVTTLLILNLIVFYANLYYQIASLRIISTMTFILSSAGIAGVAYTYYNATGGEFAMTTNLVTLALHLIIFWKSDKYYKFIWNRTSRQNPRL